MVVPLLIYVDVNVCKMFIYLDVYLCVCVSIHMCAHVCSTAHIGKTKDISQEPVPYFHLVDSED